MSVQHGLVVARHRRHVGVEDPSGARRLCQIQRRNLDPVVGDSVLWLDAPSGAIVTEVEPRLSALVRTDKHGRPETVAANLTQLLVVASIEPAPDWLVVDRYLAGAALAGIDATLVYNKVDLGAPPTELEAYRAAGYPVLLASARSGLGIDALAARMGEHLNAFVGQSGVGKSSLMNALLGTELQSVGELARKGSQGRHTTSTAMLYRLPDGGSLIDSPGVRHFAPHIVDPRTLERGFREFAAYLGRCKFADCRHIAEPGCAVKAAVEEGVVSVRRYQSYSSLYELTCRLAATRTP